VLILYNSSKGKRNILIVYVPERAARHKEYGELDKKYLHAFLIVDVFEWSVSHSGTLQPKKRSRLHLLVKTLET
jgi:hypothetical protein